MTGFVPFRGFTPSVDPTTPGAILDCANMIPTLRGMKSAPSLVAFGNPAFGSTVRGAASCELLSGSYRTIVGTGTDLYEVVAHVNNNVSHTAGAYTGGTNPWRFAQFGNATLATNGADPIQQSISSGSFAPISGAPAANIVAVTQGFVFALNINGANGPQPNGWQCSGLYDQTVWTPSQATQCATGTIVDTPGAITAGIPFGTNIIVFKGQSMFYGVYQGPPVIWAFNLISPQIGTPCQESAVSTGNAIFFLGTDFQVYRFDGTLPQPIGNEIREWLAANWSSLNQAKVQSYHDQPNSTIYWYFCSPSNTSGIPDRSLVYNYMVGKFGRADLNVEAALQAISGQITWSGMGSLPNVSTWTTLPQVPYNSAFWSQAAATAAIVDSTNTLQTLSGVSASSSITTGAYGDDYSYMSCQGVLPRFTQSPASCTGQATAGPTLDALLGAQGTVWPLGNLYDGELAGDFAARWMQFELSFTGNHEIIGMLPRVQPSGEI